MKSFVEEMEAKTLEVMKQHSLVASKSWNSFAKFGIAQIQW